MLEKRYNNYHKHTSWSNVRTRDCIVSMEEYMKRAVELGHTNYFTTEHGWQGNIFSAFTLCQKYGLKCIYGVEAYYVDNIHIKEDRKSYHLMLVALNKSGQKQINKILSIANTEGFYYKPRIDLNCLLSLNPDDVIITTACVAGRMFKQDWEEKFFIPVLKHFNNNFYLEVQNHNDNYQKEYNKKILEISHKYNVRIIHANDSHYIYPEDAEYRNIYLKAKGISYPDESNFILDYPNYNEIVKRYREQGILNEEEIYEALENTLIFDNADGIEIDKEFKIPDINYEFLSSMMNKKYTNKNSDYKILQDILKLEWSKEKIKIQENDIKKYENEIYYETNIVKQCGMSRYFIIDYMIAKHAVEDYGAVMTRSGRGSAVSFYINHLLRLTEVDRLKSPITLYPTRFMSAERILKSKSLPDIDQNYASVDPVIHASKDILGEDGIYYMVAYKPLQKASAFRVWCKGIGLEINEYDSIAKDIEKYENDSKWSKIIKDSEKFIGVIDSIAPSPCSFLLLSQPISEEIGLIKVGDVICCCIDGYNCDVYKYLKNDFLTVSVYEIINKVYNEIGLPIDDINSLIEKCDDKVWEIYENGLTTTINQCDSDFAKQSLKKYKPKSLSELSALVAAIRPGFSSLLDNFLNRKQYSTGVKELDNILEDSFHYMMYQESIMKYLVWLGIEEKETYDIIKKISKKKFKEEELSELQKKLKDGWIKNVGSENGFLETWKVVQDAAHYSFNASHSLCVAIDSLYGAYLKSHYPLEYFSIVLSFYANDTEKTAKLIEELSYFNIELNQIEYGKSKASYTFDRMTNSIYKGVESVKYCNSKIGNELFELSKKIPQSEQKTFLELLPYIKKTSSTSNQLKILIILNYFKKFGNNKYLLEVLDIYNDFHECNIINKKKIKYYEDKYCISEYLIKTFSEKETQSQYRGINNKKIIQYLVSNLENKSLTVQEQIKNEFEYLEYTDYKNNKINKCFYIVIEFKTYKSSSNPYLKLRNLNSGEEIKCRIKNSNMYKQKPFGKFAILNIHEFTYDFKKKLIEGKWKISDDMETVLENYSIVKG